MCSRHKDKKLLACGTVRKRLHLHVRARELRWTPETLLQRGSAPGFVFLAFFLVAFPRSPQLDLGSPLHKPFPTSVRFTAVKPFYPCT